MKATAVGAVMEEVDRRLLAGEFDEAIGLLERARDDDPSNYLILQRLGDLYRSLERPSEAINAYEQAIALAPDHGELWAKKGDALIDAREGAAAVAAFHQASSLTPSVFTEYDWNLRAERSYSYSDYATARRLYEAGLAVHPNAGGWRGLGLVAVAQGDLDRAVKAYKKGLDLEPRHVDLLNALGLAYRQQGRLDKAIGTFEKLVELDPKEPNWRFNLALVRRESGDYAAAYDGYLSVINDMPEDADAWLELGLCELNLGEGDRRLHTALSSFERATELDERSFWAWSNAGWTLAELGQFDEAVERLDRAIELDEREISPWHTKVFALARLGDVRRAEATASRMLKVVDDRAEALAAKGRLLADWTHKYAEALDSLRAALDLRPDDVWIEVDIAEVLLKVGRYAESRKAARKLLHFELSEDHRCGMLFVIYAAYVLEGTKSPRRRDAFLEFIEYYRSHFASGPRPVSWTYAGLVDLLHRDPEIAKGESAFLLSMAIDLQIGTIDPRSASFFTGKAEPPAQPASL